MTSNIEKQADGPKKSSEDARREQSVDETLSASFPASDPPNWTLGVGTRSPNALSQGVEGGNQEDAMREVKRSKTVKRRKLVARACADFPMWMQDGSLCEQSPEISVLGIRMRLPIFPT